MRTLISESSIAIVVRAGDEIPTRSEHAGPTLELGTAPRNAVVLTGPGIAAVHARLFAKDGRLILVDLQSDTGTAVNGRRLTAPVIIRPFDQISIGRNTVHVGLVSRWSYFGPPANDTELRLVAAIRSGDLAARVVYADWLDEHGQPERAEFVRSLHAYEEASPVTRSAARPRLDEAAEAIDAGWRMRITRPRIRACEQPGCVRDFAALRATADEHVRACERCSCLAVFCTASRDAETEQQLGNRVAVDSLLDP